MKKEQKHKIVNALNELIAKSSQNKVANTLNDVSAATINHMVNNKWELIKDEMWLNVANQMKWQLSDWVTVKTRDYKMLTSIFADAQANSISFGITGDTGGGKSEAAKHYAANNKNVYRLGCSEFWNRKYFLGQLLIAMGRDAGGFTVAQMMSEVVKVLKSKANPIIIFDEADKLPDQVLYFFITLYNELEDHCAFILLATSHLSKRLLRGVRNNKKGHREIYSRLGKIFIELKGVGQSDVRQICIANGVSSEKEIKDIYEDCAHDIRRVKRKIHAIKKRQNDKNKAA